MKGYSIELFKLFSIDNLFIVNFNDFAPVLEMIISAPTDEYLNYGHFMSS